MGDSTMVDWFTGGGWKSIALIIAAIVALFVVAKFWYIVIPVAVLIFVAMHWETVKGWFTDPNPPSTGPPSAAS